MKLKYYDPKTILKEVVNNLELYITYYDEDEFPKKRVV